MIKEQKLWKTGNSTVLTVPIEIMNKLNVKSGDTLELTVEDDEVKITKKQHSDLDILELVDRTLDRHGEIIKGLIDK